MFQIDKKKMKAEGMAIRVKKEVEIHYQLKHPSIVEVRSTPETHETTIYIIGLIWRYHIC